MKLLATLLVPCIAKSAPAGYTLVTAFDRIASRPFEFTKVPDDTLQDLAPVALLIRDHDSTAPPPAFKPHAMLSLT